jgi:lysozyme
MLWEVMLFLSVSVSGIFGHPYIDAIKHYEGFSSKVYTCPAGKKTVGYGHVLSKGEAFSSPLSQFQADLLLYQDISKAIFNLEKIAPELFKADEHRLEKVLAVTSFIFNVGESNFRSSTLLKKIRSKEWSAAANEFLRWNKTTDPKTGTKVELAGLTKRRQSEALLFSEGKTKIF